MGESFDYEETIRRLTDPDIPIAGVGRPLHGEEAAAAGREMMLREYGSEEALERALRPGRPGLSEPGNGPSPTVRARISRHDFDELARLRARTGRTEADLLREGVHLLLERYATAG
jgi:hypothetical protein